MTPSGRRLQKTKPMGSKSEVSMKQGKSLVDLARQLEDIKQNSKDYLVPATKLSMNDSGQVEFTNGKRIEVKPTSHAHSQIASYAGVPKVYYDRLREEAPELLARNVNHGFGKQHEEGGRGGKAETRMVRTYHGDMRALVSSSYRRLDSYDMCEAVLPIVQEKKMQVVSSEITDTRVYIKALSPRKQTEIKKGDVVQYGLVISNSDVGAGSVRVEPLIYRLICTNGLICDTAINKKHVGRNMAGDDIQELLTAQTIDLTEKAFWAQVRDVVLASMDPKRFEAEVQKLRDAADQKIQNFDIPDVVEMTMRTVGVSGDDTKNSIVAYLANGADGAGLTKWGLINGFTYAAQRESISYDQSIEMERAGSKILELNDRQWRRISESHS